jgi:hypothetical protein
MADPQDHKQTAISDLLTISMVRDLFPDDGGYRPSLKLLRETAKRLGLGRKWGRTYYLTEAEADALLLAGSQRRPERVERPVRPPRVRRGSATERALELSKRLEKLGLK